MLLFVFSLASNHNPKAYITRHAVKTVSLFFSNVVFATMIGGGPRLRYGGGKSEFVPRAILDRSQTASWSQLQGCLERGRPCACPTPAASTNNR